MARTAALGMKGAMGARGILLKRGTFARAFASLALALGAEEFDVRANRNLQS